MILLTRHILELIKECFPSHHLLQLHCALSNPWITEIRLKQIRKLGLFMAILSFDFSSGRNPHMLVPWAKIYRKSLLLAVPKHKTWSVLFAWLTLFEPKTFCSNALQGRKPWILYRDAMCRGKENQRQGEGINIVSILYTPVPQFTDQSF